MTVDVVGSGAIGASIAFELASRGRKVVRIGEVQRETAASMAAGAMNGCFGEITQTLIGSEYGRLKVCMDIEARKLWPAWMARLADKSGNQTPLITAHGTHVILNSAGMAQVDSINYAAIEYALQDHNERYKIVIPATPCEIANSAALTWLKPNDLVRPLQALYIPAEHAVDSHMLLDKLDAALLASGGEIIEQNAATLETHGHAIAVVRLIDDRLISCKQVVVAAGVHSLSLLSKQPEVQSRIPPLFAGYGVSILAKLPEGHTMPSTVIRTPNRAFACGLHCVPRSKDVLYIGATNILAEVPRTHALISDVQFLLDCAVDQLNLDLHDAQILKVKVGNRPIPADGFPLIGQAGYEGLWLATGTYRDGLHQSPLIATYIADAMKDESDGTKAESKTLDLSVFTPLRQPLQHVKREDTVAETVRQMFATGYEYRWNVKPYWLPLLDKGMHNNYATLLDQLHPTFAPPPEIVAFSYLYPTFRERLTRYYRSWS